MPTKQHPKQWLPAVAGLLVSSALLGGCASTATSGAPENGLDAAENIAKKSPDAGSATSDSPPPESQQVEKGSEEDKVSEKDPWEGFNRSMYGFNETVDEYVAEPITSAYQWITPSLVQTGIANFFSNTKELNVVLNDILQGKFSQSASDSGRFLLNTTVGLGGIFDIATPVGLEQHNEDFDQTLAVWGVSEGNYVVLPFLGPSTTRGLSGSVVDTAANPVTYIGYPAQILAALNARANAEGALKFIDEAALDPYIFTRESFLQWRQHLASDGKGAPDADIDPLENEYADDEVDLADDNTDNKQKQDENQPKLAASASSPAATPTPADATPKPVGDLQKPMIQHARHDTAMPTPPTSPIPVPSETGIPAPAW